MSELLTDAVLPASAAEGVDVLHEAFRTAVGVDLRSATDERVLVPEFDSGGMSGGWVHIATWRNRLMPLLEDRLEALVLRR
jgi:hypothetical protein